MRGRNNLFLDIIGTDRDRKTGALRALLATADGHNLTYAGAAFIGLRGDTWDALGERLKHLAIKHAPLRGLRMKDAQWVEPRITAKVRHLAGAKYLRHAVLKGCEVVNVSQDGRRRSGIEYS